MGIAFETCFVEGQASSYIMLEHDNKRTKYDSALQNDWSLMFPFQGVYCQNYRKWMHEEMFYNKCDIINFKYFTWQDLSWTCRMIEKDRFLLYVKEPREVSGQKTLTKPRFLCLTGVKQCARCRWAIRSQIVNPNASCSVSCLCLCRVTHPDSLAFSCRFFRTP